MGHLARGWLPWPGLARAREDSGVVPAPERQLGPRSRARRALPIGVAILGVDESMSSNRGYVVLLIVAVAVAACGYVRSGTWDDAPENWYRAFKTTKPDGIVVVHSRYWRAPHWTYEAGYVFEIQPHAALREQLFAGNRLRKLQDAETANATRPCFGECPSWFAPKPLKEYEIWVYADDPNSNFRVLIDTETGHIFLADYQV